MGIEVRTASLHDGGIEIRAAPASSDPQPLDLSVPGDFSSAAFLLALGLAGERPVRIDGVCLNATRTGLLAVLTRMGGRIDVEAAADTGGEPVGAVTAWPSTLHGTTVTGDEVPSLIDEIPVLAILAARATGETRIEGAGELRVKESDRLAALAANLEGLGVDVAETADSLVVRGTGRPPRGAVRALHDHRIAMAFGVLGALPGADVRVDAPGVASVSFPGFWTLLERVSRA